MRHADVAASADLSWYFGAGISTFERSTSGPMLERQALFYVRHPECGELTARPTAETRAHHAPEPDDAILVRYGRISRRLARVAAVDPLSARVLAAAFGSEGARWARHERGRTAALLVFTPSGLALLERTRQDTTRFDLSDRDRLAVEVEVDLATGGRATARRMLIVRGLVEAAELLREALQAWGRAR